MARSVTRSTVSSTTYADLFLSAEAGGSDGNAVYGVLVRNESVDANGGTVSGAIDVLVEPSMAAVGGVQAVTLYPGEEWPLSVGDRNTPIRRVQVRRSSVADGCVTFRPLMV